MMDLSKTPRCAKYFNAMHGRPDESGMNEYWLALCVAESFSEKALKKFGGINFHVMNGPALLMRMEEFLEYHSKDRAKPSRKMKMTASPLDAITAAVSNEEIEAAKTPKGAWKVSIGIVTGPPIGSQKGPLPLVASGQRA